MLLQVAHSTNGVANALNANNAGNWYGGPGADELGTLSQAHVLLESLYGSPPVPALDQFGVKGFEGIVQRLAYLPGGPAPWDTAWPAGTQGTYFAARVTGYLDIKRGGHNFFFMARHGVNFTLGGQSWRTGSYKGNDWGDFAYFYIPEDGIYPFALEFNQFDGNAALSLMEIKRLGQNSANIANYEVVNDANSATKAYVSLSPPCSVPIADLDGDHDVDLDDFGGFQACFTGSSAPPGGLAAKCTCVDYNVPADGMVDVSDLTAFLSCFTGPTIEWAASVNCPK
jgi:hypothetical protein